LVVDGAGNIYFCDGHNYYIRKIDGTGNISAFAGKPGVSEAYPPPTQTEPCWNSNPNNLGYYNGVLINPVNPATSVILGRPLGLALDPNNPYLYIADEQSMAVWQVNVSTDMISLFAGNCTNCDEGWITSMDVTPGILNPSNTPATSAGSNLFHPSGVAVDTKGDVFIADQEANAILEVPSANGTNYGISMIKGDIYIVAGNGYYSKQTNANDTYLAGGFTGDGGPATSAELYWPRNLTVDGSGNIYISDTHNNRIRKVNASGIITTIAGNGVAGFSGDGGQATSAEIYSPDGITIYQGNIYIADKANNRIRQINNMGVITTVAGNGTMGFGGDNGPATAAELAFPSSVGFNGSGTMYICDYYNSVIRSVK
jgi:internalin A